MGRRFRSLEDIFKLVSQLVFIRGNCWAPGLLVGYWSFFFSRNEELVRFGCCFFFFRSGRIGPGRIKRNAYDPKSSTALRCTRRAKMQEDFGFYPNKLTSYFNFVGSDLTL